MAIENSIEFVDSTVDPNGSLVMRLLVKPGESGIWHLEIRDSKGTSLACIHLTSVQLRELRDLCSKAIVMEQAPPH